MGAGPADGPRRFSRVTSHRGRPLTTVRAPRLYALDGKKPAAVGSFDAGEWARRRTTNDLETHDEAVGGVADHLGDAGRGGRAGDGRTGGDFEVRHALPRVELERRAPRAGQSLDEGHTTPPREPRGRRAAPPDQGRQQPAAVPPSRAARTSSLGPSSGPRASVVTARTIVASEPSPAAHGQGAVEPGSAEQVAAGHESAGQVAAVTPPRRSPSAHRNHDRVAAWTRSDRPREA